MRISFNNPLNVDNTLKVEKIEDISDATYFLNLSGYSKLGSIEINTVTNNLVVLGSMKAGSDSRNCDSSLNGTIRYNTSLNQLQYCNSTSWTDFGTGDSGSGSGSSAEYLVNEIHTKDDCVFDGGVVVDDGTGNFMCKFSGATCPVSTATAIDWVQYNSWTTEHVVECTGGTSPYACQNDGVAEGGTCSGTSCRTDSHTFMDKSYHYTCSYNDASGDLYNCHCSLAYPAKTCTSYTSEVGCY